MAPATPRTFFLVAGEESGDLHGARLIRALRERQPGSRCVGHGGNLMAAEGLELIEHAENLAVMGFVEVLKRLPYFRALMRTTLKRLEELRPERLILIDYPGFNLRLARKVQPLGIPVSYFILPQVWAWREQRVKILRRYVDQSLCIFPFEADWFAARGVPAHFVGHPFTEPYRPALARGPFLRQHALSPKRPLVALFPGSRQQEVDRHWDIFLQTVRLLEQYFSPDRRPQFIVGRAPGVNLPAVQDSIRVESAHPRLALYHAQAALVASGTATLEAAVFNVPAAVCYRMAPLSWSITRALARVPFAAMVNLIAGRRVVDEFLQQAMRPARLAAGLQALLRNTSTRERVLSGYTGVRQKLGRPGAYARAAAHILQARDP